MKKFTARTKLLIVILSMAAIAAVGEAIEAYDDNKATVETWEEEETAAADPVDYDPIQEEELLDLADYHGEVANNLGVIANNEARVDQLVTEWAYNPSVYYSESWLKSTSGALFKIKDAAQNIRNMDVPDRLEEAHRLIDLAMLEYIFAAENYPVAIDRGDLDLYKEIETSLENAGYLLDQSGPILEAATDGHYKDSY